MVELILIWTKKGSMCSKCQHAKLCWPGALWGFPGTRSQAAECLLIVWGGLAEKELQERLLQPPHLLISIVVLAAHRDLHGKIVNASSCSGLSLPHLYNYNQTGSLYIKPSRISFCSCLHFSKSQGLSAGGASRQPFAGSTGAGRDVHPLLVKTNALVWALPCSWYHT